MTLIAQTNKQATDAHFWYTESTTAEPEVIWNIWTDVANWKQWDIGLKDAGLSEEFTLNAKGYIIDNDGRKSKFKVTEFEEGISYTYKVPLFLSSLNIKRYLEVKNGQTYFTHEVWFKGITKGIFVKMLGAEFRQMLPEVLQNIKRLAEQ